MATRPTLPSMPSIDMTRFDLSKVKFPKVDLPKVELPKIELPKIELPKVDATKVTGVARDGMYATIGLGVVGVQQATELAKHLTTKVTDLVQRAA